MITTNKYTIYNLTNKVPQNFPHGIALFNYSLIVPPDLWQTIKEFFESKPDVFVPVPNILRHESVHFDWTTYIVGDKMYYVGLSERAFNDAEFKSLIVEYLL